MEDTARHPDLDALDALIGQWATKETHPMLPGEVVKGRATFEWLEGERFLINRSTADHPQFPDSISVVGVTEEGLSMHYFDSRGVYRVYLLSMSDGVMKIWRDAPGFSQRFTGRLEDGGDTIAGKWQLSQDDATWNDDLEITYRRSF